MEIPINITHGNFPLLTCRGSYPTTPHHITTLVLCSVVYLCHFEGCLECIYMGILGIFIHSGFGDGSGPVGRMTDQRLLYYTIVVHLAHLEFEWTLCTV